MQAATTSIKIFQEGRPILVWWLGICKNSVQGVKCLMLMYCKSSPISACVSDWRDPPFPQSDQHEEMISTFNELQNPFDNTAYTTVSTRTSLIIGFTATPADRAQACLGDSAIMPKAKNSGGLLIPIPWKRLLRTVLSWILWKNY